MPFAGYSDFAACVAANQDKNDPDAYCGSIKAEVENMKKRQIRKNGQDFYEEESDLKADIDDEEKVIEKARRILEGRSIMASLRKLAKSLCK